MNTARITTRLYPNTLKTDWYRILTMNLKNNNIQLTTNIISTRHLNVYICLKIISRGIGKTAKML